MGKITKEMTAQAYELSKKVHEGNLTHQAAVDGLLRSGMNEVSALFYIKWFEYMLTGKRMTRQINAYATEYYLSKIFEDYGHGGLSMALRTLSLHLDYYEEASGSIVKQRRVLLEKYRELLGTVDVIIYPDDVTDVKDYKEGKTKTVTVNIYERNVEARNECIAHYGAKCQVCSFSFADNYGDIGAGFIHVHHLRELSSIGKEYDVDPIKDLIPVCPNCHAMLHKRKKAYTIGELKERMKNN